MLPQGEVFEDEVLSGTDYTENPAEEMSKQHDHGQNLIGTPVISACRQVIDSASVPCFGDRQGQCGAVRVGRPAAYSFVTKSTVRSVLSTGLRLPGYRVK